VQGFLSSQSAAGASHAPAAHTPCPLHDPPSKQALPSGTGATTHAPVFGSQPTVTQSPPAGQVTTVTGSTAHAPPTQRGTPLQRSPSSSQSASSTQSHTFGPTHAPAWQVSPTVQAFESSHTEPVGAGWTSQPSCASQVPTVHGPPAGHATAAPGLQVPTWQESPLVHALASSHGAALCECTQPTPAWQTSLVQGLLSSHSSACPPPQAPAAQASPTVQGWPSSQGAPFGDGATPQVPVAGSHTEAAQGPAGGHTTAVPAVSAHLPALHCQSPLQGSKALPAQSASTAQAQAMGWPAQTPPAQVSAPVQSSPSSHGPAAGTFTQPLTRSQRSAVQGLPSSQAAAGGTHAPAWQVAPSAQVPAAPQAVPSGASPATHSPVEGTQASGRQGLGDGGQTTAFAPSSTQTPSAHRRAPSQRSTSKAAQSPSTTHAQRPLPPPQTPALQRSPLVHGSSSTQAAPSARGSMAQPVAGRHSATEH
jgi:hypothetical protein